MSNLNNEFKNSVMPFLESFIDAVAEKVVEKVKPILKEPKDVRYYNRKEVCDILDISLPTLKKLTDRGVLTAVKMGDKRVLYPSDALQAVKESGLNIKYVRR